MATEEHKRLSTIIKSCHESLRLLSKQYGPEFAWEEHIKNAVLLKEYSEAMQKLALIWDDNSAKDDQLAKSRIKWIIDYCMAYFFSERIYLEKRLREQRLLESWDNYDTSMCKYNEVSNCVKVLDVGSCYNPFAKVENFDVTAIDLCPANDTVYRGDYLKISVEDVTTEVSPTANGEITRLPKNYFNCVVFSLLLEYIPSSDQRLECCQKAYNLLKFEGILIVITPDSQHVGKNAKLMKNWRYTLGTFGFNRIKFEKLPHIACMVFRKASDPRVAQRWAELHREPQTTIAIDIPQDNKNDELN